MRARHLLPAVFCLLAGFAVQTLIAWGCSVYSPLTYHSGVIPDPKIVPGTRSEAGFRYPDDWTARSQTIDRGFGRVREFTSEQVWMGSRPGLMENAGRQAAYQGFGGGWPMISMVGADYISRGIEAFAPPKLVAGPAWLGTRVRQTMLPVWPLWPGAAVNTLVFGVPLWLGWAGLRRCRMALRRKKGLCLRCGYPVRGLDACPECGTVATKEAA
jgi:hypothetical protein